MEYPMTDSKTTRRQFVRNAAMTALPTIIPASVLARRGRKGANDRIVVACIGVGGQGRTHVPADVAVLCDVDAGRVRAVADTVMKSGKRTVSTPPEMVDDYRRILERKDIDA